jgi:hypothetical protein
MNSSPCRVPIEFAEPFIGRSRKTLVNWKYLGRAPFLGHVDNNGQLSRRLHVDVQALAGYLIREGRHDPARRFIDAVCSRVAEEKGLLRESEQFGMGIPGARDSDGGYPA